MRVVYGLNPVRELLRAGGGPSELWLAEGGTRGAEFAELERLGRAAGAKVRSAPRAKLERLAGTDRHQGVVAVVADFRYAELQDVLAAAGRPSSSSWTASRTRTTSARSSAPRTRSAPTA
jgi:23S rRNA (guanosine2251-2'-O)-methyltransferase